MCFLLLIPSLRQMKRTQHCNELRPGTLANRDLEGWVHSRPTSALSLSTCATVRGHADVLTRRPAKDCLNGLLAPQRVRGPRHGKVRARPEGTNNPKIPTW